MGGPGSGGQNSLAHVVREALEINDRNVGTNLRILQDYASNENVGARIRIECAQYLLNRALGMPKTLADMRVTRIDLTGDEYELILRAADTQRGLLRLPLLALPDTGTDIRAPDTGTWTPDNGTDILAPDTGTLATDILAPDTEARAPSTDTGAPDLDTEELAPIRKGRGRMRLKYNPLAAEQFAETIRRLKNQRETT